MSTVAEHVHITFAELHVPVQHLIVFADELIHCQPVGIFEEYFSLLIAVGSRYCRLDFLCFCRRFELLLFLTAALCTEAVAENYVKKTNSQKA